MQTSYDNVSFFSLLYHLYFVCTFMIHCQESVILYISPLCIDVFYVKTWRTVWIGAIKVNKLFSLLRLQLR